MDEKKGILNNNYIRLYILIIIFVLGFLIVATDYILGLITAKRAVLNLLLCLCLACAGYYIPGIVKWFRQKSIKTARKKELRFLKKLFVLCGSIKPVDYMSVMKALILRSAHFKTGLQGIADVYRKSNVIKEEYFSKLIEEEKDIDVRLFYEKLNIAANYDFDQAVGAIAGDFNQEKRAYTRYVKKKVELIHIIGVAGLFVALAVMMLYMLQPWLQSMNMGAIL